MAKEIKNDSTKRLSAMKRLEKEDTIADWLQSNGLDDNREATETFAEADFSTDDFEIIRNDSGIAVLLPILRWLENVVTCQRRQRTVCHSEYYCGAFYLLAQAIIVRCSFFFCFDQINDKIKRLNNSYKNNKNI